MNTDSDGVTSWLQPSPRRYSKSRKSRQNREDSRLLGLLFKDVEQAEEEIIAISPTTHDAREPQDASSESEPPASKPKPQKLQVKLPLALRRLSAHNWAVIR